jgi:hypothetical protein
MSRWHEIVFPVMIEIAHERAGLLRGRARHRKIARRGGQVLPCRIRRTPGRSQGGERQDKEKPIDAVEGGARCLNGLV